MKNTKSFNPINLKTMLSIELTLEERLIILHLAQGLTRKQIAPLLYLSPFTLDHRITALFERMDCRNSAELVNRAWELEIITKKAEKSAA